MFEGIIGSLITKEQKALSIQNTLQDFLEKKASELKLKHDEICLMILSSDAEFNQSYVVCKLNDKGQPIAVQKTTILEVLKASDDDE